MRVRYTARLSMLAAMLVLGGSGILLVLCAVVAVLAGRIEMSAAIFPWAALSLMAGTILGQALIR